MDGIPIPPNKVGPWRTTSEKFLLSPKAEHLICESQWVLSLMENKKYSTKDKG
jgi:hypothetical protein